MLFEGSVISLVLSLLFLFLSTIREATLPCCSAIIFLPESQPTGNCYSGTINQNKHFPFLSYSFISLSFLVALSKVSQTMLNINTINILVLCLIFRVKVVFLTLYYDLGCWFVTDGFYQIEIEISIPTLCTVIFHKCVLDFVKCFWHLLK